MRLSPQRDDDIEYVITIIGSRNLLQYNRVNGGRRRLGMAIGLYMLQPARCCGL